MVPLLAFVGWKRRIPALTALVVVAPVARLLVSMSVPYPAVCNFTTCHLDVFALGVLLASLDHNGSPRWRRVRAALSRGRWPALIAAGGVSALTLLSTVSPAIVLGQGSPLTYLLAAGCWSYVLMRATDTPAADERASPVLAWVGRRSCGIYVFHWPAVIVGSQLASSWGVPSWLAGILALGLTFAVSEVSWRWLESPFLRLKTRFR